MMEVVDDAAMFLFNLFMEEPQVLNKHKTQLRIMFGAVTPALSEKICIVSKTYLINKLKCSFGTVGQSSGIVRFEVPWSGCCLCTLPIITIDKLFKINKEDLQA